MLFFILIWGLFNYLTLPSEKDLRLAPTPRLDYTSTQGIDTGTVVKGGPETPLPTKEPTPDHIALSSSPTPTDSSNPGTPSHRPASLSQTYSGTHQTEFLIDYDRVRILVPLAQLEVSARLGLIQYREGFQYPIQIRFQDGLPPGLENALAYVQLKSSITGFVQELVINLDELIAHPMDFDTVFYHEMTHAVMNDAVGGEASLRIPHWLQEGLAIYVSGEGDARVKAAAEVLYKSQAPSLAFDLDGPVRGAAYPQYYLAVKYILDKYSINAVQGIARELIEGKTLEFAIQDNMALSPDQYKKEVQQYSLRIFKDIAKPDTVPLPNTAIPHLNHF